MASVRPFTERDGNMPIHRGKTMKLLLDTIVLRPYVFAFFLAFLLAGRGDLGWRRTLFFGAWVWPLAWLAEFASTRIGVPFGLYHYTGTTRGQEVYVDNVPLMDSLSFTFLAYAAFCLARVVLAGRAVSRVRLAIVSGRGVILRRARVQSRHDGLDRRVDAGRSGFRPARRAGRRVRSFHASGGAAAVDREGGCEGNMSVPLSQMWTVATYVLGQRLR